MRDQPLYRRSRLSPLAGYSTRILLCLAGSVTGVLLLVHTPFSTSSNQVGWSARPVESIALTDVQREDPASASAEDEEAPPPTQHSSPQSNRETGAGTSPQNASSAPEPTSDETSSPDPVRALSALSAEDEVPEIMGGIGAFYLHIQYPPAARRQGIEGRLELRFTVTRQGEVRRIRVAQSLHPLCDSAAVRALRSVRFAPGTHDGTPVPVRMSLPVRFTLRSAPSPLPSAKLRSAGQ